VRVWTGRFIPAKGAPVVFMPCDHERQPNIQIREKE
jgi:hypothetical protein